MLGNYRSDLEEYEESKEAYRKALACPDVNGSSVQYNLAIVLGRQGRYSESLLALEEVTDEAMASHVMSQRLAMLNAQKRFDEVISLGVPCFHEMDEDDETPAERLASIGSELAWAYWHGEGDREGAMELALASVRQNHTLDRALWLIREIEGRVSPANKLYRLLIDGDWPWPKEDGILQRFVISCDVIAESPEQAMGYVIRCEDPDLRDSLTIDECKEVESRPSDPAGVYRIGKYHLYPQGVT